MDIFDGETHKSSTLPPDKKRQVSVSDSDTNLLPVTPSKGHRQIEAQQGEKIILPFTSLPSNRQPLDQRQAPRPRRVSFEVQPAHGNTSPEVARLMEHRTQVASQETMRLQAFVATSEVQDKAQSATSTPQTDGGEQKKSRWRPFRKRQVPVLLQSSIVECGAACLAMLLSYHGRKTSVLEVHERCGVGRDGLSALAIVKAARNYGMRVRAVSLKENDFRFVTLPAIVHWEFNHFIVVERWTPKYVYVVDPEIGRRRMTAKEFDENFTGVVIMLEPGAHFSRESKPPKLNLLVYAKFYLRQDPKSLIQVLAASLLLQLLGLVFPLLSAVAINTLIPNKMINALYLYGIGVILLTLAQLTTSLLRTFILLYLETHVNIKMVLNFLEHLMSLPQRFFLQHSTGDVLARVGSNAAIRDTISNQLFSTLLDGSFVLIYLGILISQSLSITLIVLVCAALQIAVLFSTTKIISDLNRQDLAASGKASGYITEALAGIRTLKAAGAEQRALERWTSLFFDQINVGVRRTYISTFIGTVMGILGTSGPLLMLWIGIWQVIDGTMPLGTMLALNIIGTSVLGPLTALASTSQGLQLVRAHIDRLADVAEAEPEQDIHAASLPPRLRGYVKLEHVYFQYDPQSAPVLNDINLTISPGQKVALVGRTGAGKSTLGNLLLGLYTPTKGEIFYDGILLRKLNYQAVRSQFGVVIQEATLFSGSVRENITLNDPSLDMERVIRAARLAAIHDDIMQMPMEYETMVSEGGSALSGGQRQRIALARALVNNPAILLLDEATSSLDVVTEQAVERNLRELACTQIIIAHRLSTIRNADVILVLDQGKIAEQGTHDELLSRNGYYARLIQSQLAGGEIKAD